MRLYHDYHQVYRSLIVSRTVVHIFDSLSVDFSRESTIHLPPIRYIDRTCKTGSRYISHTPVRIPIYNHIFLIPNELQARWEISNKVISDSRYGGHPKGKSHYCDVLMGATASRITSLTIVYSSVSSQITSLTIVYLSVSSGTDQRKHQSSASLAFVRGIHRWLVNSPRKGSVIGKSIPFYNVIMHTQPWWKT